MKSALVSLAFLAICTSAFAETRFSDRLSAAERKNAGLDLLSPEQLDALNLLVKKDQSRDEKVVREKLKVEVRQEVAEEVRKEAKAEVLKDVEDRRVAEVRILSKIIGPFSGWSGNTIFKLENGQEWRQAETTVYFSKPQDSPAILIEKVYGGWRLYDQVGGWVRVIRIK